MSEKIYLHLLIFCGILCQGIFATLSDEDTRVSSDFLVRKRRVINHLPSGQHSTRIEDANYIVKIREGCHAKCTGVILSHYTVITAAPCIRRNLSTYKILSGAAYDQRTNSHSVTSNVVYYGSPPRQYIDGIALVTVDPPFEYSSKTGNIHLHLGPLPVGTLVTVFGWGHLYPIQPGTEVRPRLHSITLPIMYHDECENIYRNNSNHVSLQNTLTITEKHICTYDAQQYCARGDVGAPLVVNNMLVGIHVYKGEYQGLRNPDVYVNLKRTDYREWITEHSLLM